MQALFSSCKMDIRKMLVRSKENALIIFNKRTVEDKIPKISVSVLSPIWYTIANKILPKKDFYFL